MDADFIDKEKAIPEYEAGHAVFPLEVSQLQLDEWFQATSPSIGNIGSTDISLGAVYKGTFVNEVVLDIQIVDAKGASDILLKYGEDALNFRVIGNLSDSVGGIIYGGGATKGNTTYTNMPFPPFCFDV